MCSYERLNCDGIDFADSMPIMPSSLRLLMLSLASLSVEVSVWAADDACRIDIIELGRSWRNLRPVMEEQLQAEAVVRKWVDEAWNLKENKTSIMGLRQSLRTDPEVFEANSTRYRTDAMLDLVSTSGLSGTWRDNIIESTARFLSFWQTARISADGSLSPAAARLVFDSNLLETSVELRKTSLGREIERLYLAGEFKEPPHDVLKQVFLLSIFADPHEFLNTTIDNPAKLQELLRQRTGLSNSWGWLTSNSSNLKDFRDAVLAGLRLFRYAQTVGTRGIHQANAVRISNGSRVMLEIPTGDLVVYMQDSRLEQRRIIRLPSESFPKLYAQSAIEKVYREQGVLIFQLNLENIDRLGPLALSRLRADIRLIAEQFAHYRGKMPPIRIEGEDSQSLARLMNELTGKEWATPPKLSSRKIKIQPPVQRDEDKRFKAGSTPIPDNLKREVLEHAIIYAGYHPSILDEANAFKDARVLQLKKGETLLKDGDESHYVYVVVDGEFEIKKNGVMLRDGRVRAGFLGDFGLTSGRRRTADVFVGANSQSATVVGIPKETFQSYWLTHLYTLASFNRWLAENSLSPVTSLSPIPQFPDDVLLEVFGHNHSELASLFQAIKLQTRKRMGEGAHDLETQVQRDNAKFSSYFDLANQFLNHERPRPSKLEFRVVEMSASVGGKTPLQGLERRAIRFVDQREENGVLNDYTISVTNTYKDGLVIDQEMLVIPPEDPKNSSIDRFAALKRKPDGSLADDSEIRACYACHAVYQGKMVTFASDAHRDAVRPVVIKNPSTVKGAPKTITIQLPRPMRELHNHPD